MRTSLHNIDLKRTYKAACHALRITIRPLRLNVEITDDCNLRCPTCSKWRLPTRGDELTTAQWREVLARTKGFALSRLLVVSGGEPFRRPDLLPILRRARELDYAPIVITNGTLVDEPAAAELARIAPRQVMVSLNGCTPGTHDPTRGAEGSFERTMAAIDRLVAHGIPVVLETILLNTNLQELPLLLELVEDKGLKGIVFQVLTANNLHGAFGSGAPRVPEPGWHHSDPFWIDDPAKGAEAAQRLADAKRRGVRIVNSYRQLRTFAAYFRSPEAIGALRCAAGVANFVIDPRGYVRLCYSFDPVGNVLETPPAALWRSPEAGRQRRAMRSCPASCRLLNNNW